MVQSFMDMILIQQIRNWVIDTMAITNILCVCALKYVGIVQRMNKNTSVKDGKCIIKIKTYVANW